MPYEVRLSAFEGPLDLLLHLIEDAKVDIYDIPISEITNQYLGYLREAQFLDLEVASEFLVMAATLMLIKARMLLPEPQSEAAASDPDDGGEPADPRDELVQRLLEYRQFKEVAKHLLLMEEETSKLFSREPTAVKLPKAELPLPENLTVADLFEAFQRVLRSRKETLKPFKRIPTDEINIRAAMTSVLARALRNRRISFTELLEQSVSRYEMIATFLAILELTRLRKICVRQATAFSDIEIALREDSGDDDPGRSQGGH